MNAILIDITKCTGCQRCVEACKEAHQLAPDVRYPKLRSDGLSSRRLTTAVALEDGRYAKKQCVHCLAPACEEACLVGAIHKTELGPVIYDPEKCIGCRYCLLACPMGIPRYEWEKRLPYMQKCDMCFERLERGQVPACVECCPERVCEFGQRDKLLDLARQRIQDSPGKYLPHIFGEKELGGTSVLYLSDVDLRALGWPEKVGEKPIHSYTWPVMSKTPFLGTGVAIFLTGTYWIIQRRMELAGAASQSPRGEDLSNGGSEEGIE